MRVTIRVDAGPLIGGGHAMRCLTLANALAERGDEVTFVTARMPDGLRERITSSGHRLAQIDASPEFDREGENWHTETLGADAQADDARATGLVTRGTDWLVADHYLLDARWHSAGRTYANRILVIDDLANRRYDCDLLLDQNLGSSSDDYRKLVPAHAEVLTGARYALLRPEFARGRHAALQRRGGSAKRILICLGTTDPDGLTAQVTSEVLAAAPNCTVDVVIGSRAASLPRLQQVADENALLKVHVDSNRMAELMRDADIAIGASGATSWERCCLGLPTLTLILAGNQRRTAESLQRAGAAKIVEIGNLQQSLREWLKDPAELRSYSERAAEICDGLGTSRVTSALLDMETADVG